MASTKLFLAALCLIVLVNQIEMLPLEPVTELPARTGGLLARVKRTVIGDLKCGVGRFKLFRTHGPCVTCEEYLDRTDNDECPN